MKKSINKDKALRLTLQSLPIVTAAVAIILYLLSFRPLSVNEMTAGNVMLRYESHYELTADGRLLFVFKTIGDSLLPEDLHPGKSPETVNRTLVNGCFVNRLPLPASCRGTILTVNLDSMQAKRMSAAGKNLISMLQKTVARTAKEIKTLEKKEDECGYFLNIHNVNDDGFNTIAEYSEQVKAERQEAEAIVERLNNALKGGHLSLIRIRKYTLLYNKDGKSVEEKTCRIITKDSKQPFCLIQTADKKTPDKACAVNLHRWFSPSIKAGQKIIVASSPDFLPPGEVSPVTGSHVFEGEISRPPHHNLPQSVAPDGSVVFTDRGITAGVIMQGRVVTPEYFGFNFKLLRP